MTRGRLLIAGLTATAAMMAADASAQNCPEYLTLNCPNESLTVPAEEAAAQGEQATTRGKPGAPGARAKQTRPAAPAATDAAANPKPQQVQTTASAPASARPARTARPALNPQEKEALFQQFLTWREERRQSPPATNR